MSRVRYDAQLRAPEQREGIENTTASKVPRATATQTTPNQNRFLLDLKEQSHQFFNIYLNRLKSLRPSVLEKVRQHKEKMAPNAKIEERILDITLGTHCYIIGTVFKEMPLKPNVLREYTKEQAILLVPEHENFVSAKDSLVLEDEGGRVKLVVTDPTVVADYVTGTIVGVLGHQVDGGAFQVETILTPGIPPQTALPSHGKKFVALVSGLNIGTATFNPLFSAMLSDYLCGHLGSEDEISAVSARVVRTILAGNTFCSEEEVPAHNKLRDHTKSFTVLDQTRLDTVLREVDGFIFELCANMPVDLIPGPRDPSNYSLPQQPLNRCLLPRAAQLSSLNLSTNPYSAIIDGVEFLGHSGQPTQNIQNYITLQSEENVIDILEKTLQWRHLAPTAPDTLSAFPFKLHDPFVIDTCPHVYFVGDQPEFDSKLVHGEDGQRVQLIAVPSFANTRTFVLVDLENLDCHPVTLKTWDD